MLNLDRFIVANIKKGKNNFFEQIRVSFPRLILAGFIAIVIAKPLELRLFSKEIEAEIVKQNENTINEARSLSAERLSQNLQFKRLRDDRDKLSTQIKEAEGKLAYWLTRATPNKDEVNRLKDLINNKNKSLNDINNQISNLEQQTQNSLGRIKNAQQDSKSLLSQLATLERLSSSDPIIRYINLFFTLLFVLVEVSPVIVKILSRYGVYDAILENEEETIAYRYDSKTSEIKFVIQQELEVYKKTLKKELDDYRDLRETMRKHDISQQLNSYQEMRVRFQSLMKDIFLEVLNNVITKPEFSDVQHRVIDEIVRQTENELMKYSQGMQFTDNEMIELLEKIKSKIKV
ncbi:DUF4407 domain-containing protein [Nostoc mirabile]|uniref:DUF4407 domain-containing protein n=1 Tax=Nostoc mirabile TaxID=2907820 RepID=UPI001E616947|nr:DUF4407 domain-containing protein [Nostoc mirabile]